MEQWRRVWRGGFADAIPIGGLKALAEALRNKSAKLIQGGTTVPPPIMFVHDWKVEQCCGIAYCGWKNQDSPLTTVGEVEEFFSRVCFEADTRLGEPAACRHFINWFDNTPRDQMIAELLVEVEASIASRDAAQEPVIVTG